VLEAIMQDWHVGAKGANVSIITECYNMLANLRSHLLKGRGDIINSGKIVGVIEVDIRNNRIIRRIGKKMSSVFTALENKMGAACHPDARSIPDQVRSGLYRFTYVG